MTKYTKALLRLNLVYRDILVEAHDALIGVRCCSMDLELEETRCPICGADVLPTSGQVIALDKVDHLIKRYLTDEGILLWVHRRVDLILDGPKDKGDDKPPESKDPPDTAKPPTADPPKKDSDPPQQRPPGQPKKRLDESTKQIAGKMDELGWPGKAGAIFDEVQKDRKKNKLN